MSHMQQSRPRRGQGQIICSKGVGFVLNTVLDREWGCGHYPRQNQNRRSNPDCSARTTDLPVIYSNTNSLAGLQSKPPQAEEASLGGHPMGDHLRRADHLHEHHSSCAKLCKLECKLRSFLDSPCRLAVPRQR